MKQNHKHSNELLLGDLSPHFELKETGNIGEETHSGVLPTNISRTEERFNRVIQVVHHEDRSRVGPRKIRVLLVITVLGTGGATNVVLDIANYFNSHPDFDIEILTGRIIAGRTDMTALAHEQGITTQVIPSLINHVNLIINAKSVAEIRRVIVRGNYDIVHTHTSVAGVVGRLAARAARTSVIVHHVHGWGLHEEMSTATLMLKLGLERLCARLTDRIITVSRADFQKGQVHRIAGEDKLTLISKTTFVLLVITVLGTGGATNVVLDIANYFNSHPDFDIEILTGRIIAGRTDMTALAHEQGITTQVIPSLINHVNLIINAKSVAEIRRVIVRGNYDIVHTHTSVAGVVGRLAARAARTSVIVHHVHGWGLHEEMSTATLMLKLGLERLCARLTDRIITVSRADFQKGQVHRIAGEDKLTLIYNGIDLEQFRQPVDDHQMRSELGLDPNCKLVGMIGRLDRQKNPLDFIQAAAIVTRGYPKVQFLIIGDGPLHPECDRLINELNLQNKFFLLGFRNDVVRILPILTVTALSSLWEGLPLAFLESMSAGKPIVANNVDGASDVLIDGETGFLVTPHQPSEMAERILYLLNNEKLCHEMGRIAQQRSSYFSKQRTLAQIESLYKELHSAAQHCAKA